jgi:hypothetical protein
MNISEKPVITRILGLATGVVSIAILAMSVYGLLSVDTASHVLLQASGAAHVEYRQAGWKSHITVYWLTWLAAATLGMVGGIYLVMKREIGIVFVVIGSVLVLAYPFVVQILGDRAYGFEYVNYPTAATATVLAVVSVLVHFVSFKKSVS